MEGRCVCVCVCMCVCGGEGGGPGIKLKFINPAFVLIQYNLKLVTSQWLKSVHVLTWHTKIMCFCYDEGDGGEWGGGGWNRCIFLSLFVAPVTTTDAIFNPTRTTILDLFSGYTLKKVTLEAKLIKTLKTIKIKPSRPDEPLLAK